jgi:hypothetical protein
MVQVGDHLLEGSDQVSAPASKSSSRQVCGCQQRHHLLTNRCLECPCHWEFCRWLRVRKVPKCPSNKRVGRPIVQSRRPPSARGCNPPDQGRRRHPRRNRVRRLTRFPCNRWSPSRVTPIARKPLFRWRNPAPPRLPTRSRPSSGVNRLSRPTLPAPPHGTWACALSALKDNNQRHLTP